MDPILLRLAGHVWRVAALRDGVAEHDGLLEVGLVCVECGDRRRAIAGGTWRLGELVDLRRVRA